MTLLVWLERYITDKLGRETENKEVIRIDGKGKIPLKQLKRKRAQLIGDIEHQ